MPTVAEHNVPDHDQAPTVPSISSVRLIGQPDRVSRVTLVDSTAPSITACILRGVQGTFHLHFASGWRRKRMSRSATMAKRTTFVLVTLASMLRRLPGRIGHHRYQ